MTSPFLGDFVLAVRSAGHGALLQERLPARIWPRLGEDPDAPPVFRKPFERLEVAWRGGVSGAWLESAVGLGLYHLVGDVSGAEVDVQGTHEKLVRDHLAGSVGPTPAPRGKFGYAVWNDIEGHLLAVCDGFHHYPIYYCESPGLFVCGTDLRLVVAASGASRDVDPHALYHYLNFAYIPAPWSIFRNIRKLPPGSSLHYRNGEVRIQRFWSPAYPEDYSGSEEELAERLGAAIKRTVECYRPSTGVRWGTFLSGGTDSSSITGILAKQDRAAKVSSFSIGFSEGGFDELHYARIAASAFGTDSHTRYVSAMDTLELIPWLVQSYAEPFANSSAIPTAYCAKLAREHGATILVAGDGGDEIFGGNERYAKDEIFGMYYRLPRPVKRVGSMLARVAGPFDVRLLNRVKNFVRRGSLPNPDRFYSDDSFASDSFGELLSPDFRKSVEVSESLDVMRSHYVGVQSKSELHRLMYIDLMMAIADNDLVKVAQTAKATGISVMYPYLDVDLVNLTGRLPAEWKVRKRTKRYLFKKAMQDVLPPEILAKRKQGFGLPVGMWFRANQQFFELLADTVLSRRASERGYFNPGFVEQLVNRHRSGAWDHTQELWLLLVLELWHREYLDART